MNKDYKYRLFNLLALVFLFIGLLISSFFIFSLGRLIEFYWALPFLITAYFFYKKSVILDSPPEDDIDFLKLEGRELKILFSDCSILENNEAIDIYKKYGLTSYYDEEVFDKLWGREKGIENPVCIVYNHSGRILPSSLLYISKENLMVRIEGKKETLIYLHPKKDYYYFDLEFLLG